MSREMRMTNIAEFRGRQTSAKNWSCRKIQDAPAVQSPLDGGEEGARSSQEEARRLESSLPADA